MSTFFGTNAVDPPFGGGVEAPHGGGGLGPPPGGVAFFIHGLALRPIFIVFKKGLTALAPAATSGTNPPIAIPTG